jgi:hypothetical protein
MGFRRAAVDHRSWCAAELLRARADQLLAFPIGADEGTAEKLLKFALAIADEQHAAHRNRKVAPAKAIDGLRTAYMRFSEGSDTADVSTAATLLNSLTLAEPARITDGATLLYATIRIILLGLVPLV